MHVLIYLVPLLAIAALAFAAYKANYVSKMAPGSAVCGNIERDR